MAGLATVRRWNVGWGFSCRLLAVVTAEAPRCDACMIEDRCRPLRCHMAGLAVIAGGNMVERLATGPQLVMTGDAGAAGLRVVEFFDLPVRRAVAAGAFRAGRDMDFRLAGRNITIVAGEASCCEWFVVNVHLRPNGRSMALAASVSGFRMIDRLALRQSAIMAFLARRRHALEHGTGVAGFTLYRAVSAYERKPGALMVEVSVNLDAAIDLLRRTDVGAECNHRHSQGQEPEQRRQPIANALHASPPDKRGREGRRIVALGAVLAELSAMHIFLRMTAETGFR